jgi:hypothetical protein
MNLEGRGLDTLKFALDYLARGWSVIPLRPRDKKPALASWKEYQTRRPTEEEVRSWWQRWPDANIGIATGAVSGIIVLDVDGEDGRRSLEEIAGGNIPRTPHTNTGKGRHYLFRHPGGEWRNFAGKLPGLDFRGDGGYIVAPPSVHPSGRRYEWELGPDEAELADPPAWLMELLTKKPDPPQATGCEPKPVTRPPVSAGADVILANCAFCQHCRDNAETLSEPEWYAMISNLARADGGRELIHELSRPYPGYSPVETDKKIEHALRDGEPHTCAYIQDSLGFTGCPAAGCGVKAPVGFVSSPLVLAKITVDSAIRQLRQEPKREIVYDDEVIGALAVLRQRDAAEYAKAKAQIREICGKGVINLNDLERAVKQRQAKEQGLRLTQPDEKPPSLEDILPDLPIKELRRPYKWTLNENGVWQDTPQGPVCACPVPILLTKRLQNIDTGEEKVELAFYRDGQWQYITAARPTVFNRSSVVSLAAHSLPVSSESARHLVRYLSDFESANLDTLPLVKSVSHLGWIGSNRFLPGAADDIHLDVEPGGTAAIASGYRSEGTLEDWIRFIEPIRKYPIARFTLAASFAAPLLSLVNQRVFVIHNWGPSRGGKTASLKAALSVWGEPDTIMASFNATKVGLERLAGFYSDLPLGIDERQVVGDKQGFVESLVYLLGLGKGKARGAKGGGLQQFQSWRTIALTTGEEPLSTDSSTQGIKTRTLEIYGVPIEDEVLARRVHQGIASNYGTAGPAFVQRVLAELKNDPNVFKDDYQQMLEYWESKQTGHMGSHLAAVTTVMLADYYASMWIFGADDERAFQEATTLAETILGQLETAAEADEANRAYEYLMSWYHVNVSSFDDNPPREWFGIKRLGRLCIFPTVFEKAMKEGGFNPRRVLRDWADRNWIDTEIKPSDGKKRFKVRLQVNNERMFFISVKMNANKSDPDDGVSDPVTH